MSRIEEPVRWLDPRSDAPEDVRRLLADGRDALGPSGEQLARLEASVAAGAVAGGAVGGAKAAVLTKAGALKLAAVLAFGSAGAGVGWSVIHGASAPAPSPAAQVATAAAPATQAGQTAQAAQAAPLASPPQEAPTATAEPAAVPQPPPNAKPKAAPVAGIDRAPAPASAPPEPAPAPEPAAPAAAAAPTPFSPAASPAGESELALLDRARTRLATDPAGAMRALEEHRARYPGGTFAQEREVLAIEALVRMGRRAEARARADAFDRAFPGSAHRRRIAVLLGEE